MPMATHGRCVHRERHVVAQLRRSINVLSFFLYVLASPSVKGLRMVLLGSL